MAFKLGQKPGNPVINAQNNNYNLIEGSNMSMMNRNSPQYKATLNKEPDASSVVGTNPREQLNKQLGIPKNTPPTEGVHYGVTNKDIKTPKYKGPAPMSESEVFNQQFYKGYGGITTGGANIALGSGEEGEIAGGFVPGVGEVIDAKNTVQDLKKGDYAGAAMNAAGFMLPFVPGKAIKKLFGKGDGPVPAPKPMPTSNPVKEIKEQAEERFAKSRRVYENEPWDDTPIRMELDAMKQTGKKLDAEHGYFDYSQITPENAKFHGTYSGRPIAEVELPGGGTQMMYKSSGLAGKKGGGVGGTTEGLWQPYGGHANIVGSQGWFIKDAGYKDFYGSESFRNLSGQMDRLAQEGNWDMSQMIQASKNK